MKVSDIHKAFKVMMDKNAEAVAFGGCPAFLPVEIDLFLNQAYLEILSNKFTGRSGQIVSFEGSVKRTADLEQLVKTDTNVALTTGDSNVLAVEDFMNSSGTNQRMYYVTSVLHFNGEKSTCILVDHDQARAFLKTYNNYPWIDTPVATLEDNQLLVYIDDATMKAPYTLDITYIKYPQKIDSANPNTEINEVPDRILYEVIDRAVVLALENIESNRSQTKLNMTGLSE